MLPRHCACLSPDPYSLLATEVLHAPQDYALESNLRHKTVTHLPAKARNEKDGVGKCLSLCTALNITTK